MGLSREQHTNHGRQLFALALLLFCLAFQEAIAALSDRKNMIVLASDSGENRKDHAEQHWDAAELWAQSVSRNLKLVDDAIILEGEVLIEDDAAGIGSIRNDAWDTIADGVILRKYLILPDLPIKDAVISMLFYPISPTQLLGGGKLEFTVNGNGPIVYEVRHFWTSVPVPATYLKAGENVIEVTVHHASDRYRVPIALYDNFKYGSTDHVTPALRSSRSTDYGKTWLKNSSEAGIGSGEYPIRLKLQAYQGSAWLRSPIINLAEKAVGDVLLFPVDVQYAHIQINRKHTTGAMWQTRIRSGHTHRPALGGWSDWEQLNTDELPDKHKKRFIQLEFGFEANSDAESPQLTGLNISSRWVSGLATERITEIKAHKGAFTPSSYEFKHENPANPALQQFRKEFGLDKIVEGASTEWEKIKRLRGWVAGLWEWFLPDPERPDLVTWNASNILRGIGEDSDRVTGGNCLHYSIVFAQACQSFGIPARIVNTNFSVWGGHELVEVWSADFNKWIMLDPNFDSSFYDRQTDVPLNVLELHQVFLQAYYPDGSQIDRDRWSIEDRDTRSATVHPEQLPIAMEVGGHAYAGKIDQDYVWWKVTPNEANPGYSGGYGFFNTAEVRWLPRSNWLSQPLPLPITHGRTHWGWDGYYVWTDGQTPPTPEHSQFVRRVSDMYGPLFQIDFSAEFVERGEIRIHMLTDTPGFSHFELVANGETKKLTQSTYQWRLVGGSNKLEIRSVDVLGNKGAPAGLEFNYKQ